MKNFICLLLSIVSLTAYSSIALSEKAQKIDFLVAAFDPHTGAGELRPRSFVEIPEVWIDGNILYFYDVFSTTVPVFVVDASDNVVFSATLYPGEDKKILPTSLSGTYTMYMRVGTIMYSAVITI